jgi:hypothetical protein
VTDHFPLPPGWPAQVLPPVAPGWTRSATGWLLDQCPPEYRGHPVVVRHPVALAWLAGLHVAGQAQAVRRALATARADLVDELPPAVTAELLETLETERVRLIAVARAVDLVADALRGHRYVPRL